MQRLESASGVRYSILLTLPYFDPVRYTVIDPMHNLFLGTGKHSFKVWLDQGLLSKQHLAEIESKIKAFYIPTGFRIMSLQDMVDSQQTSGVTG